MACSSEATDPLWLMAATEPAVLTAEILKLEIETRLVKLRKPRQLGPSAGMPASAHRRCSRC